MADKDTELMATCSVCGAIESSTDAEALNSAMQSHMRGTHNLDWDPAQVGASIKPTNQDEDAVEGNAAGILGAGVLGHAAGGSTQNTGDGAGAAAAFGIGTAAHNARINQ